MSKITSKVLSLYSYFKDSKYSNVINEAVNKCYYGSEEGVTEILDKLPNTKDMLTQLIKLCEGKSVHTNFKRLVENKICDEKEGLKVLSSLITHSLIQETKEPYYRLLTEELLEKLNQLVTKGKADV